MDDNFNPLILEKINTLISLLSEFEQNFEVTNENIISSLYDLFVNHKIPNTKLFEDSDEINKFCYYYGIYHEYLGKNMAFAEQYYEISADKGYYAAFLKLGQLYEHKKLNLEKAEEYYIKLLSYDEEISVQCLGLLKFKQGKYKEAKNYFKYGIQYGNQICIEFLSKYYYDLKKYNKSLDIYIIGCDIGYDKFKKNINEIIRNNFDLNLACRSQKYLDKENSLQLNNELKKSEEQNISINKNLIKKICTICTNNNYIKILSCNHEICFDCLDSIQICPFCRNKI